MSNLAAQEEKKVKIVNKNSESGDDVPTDFITDPKVSGEVLTLADLKQASPLSAVEEEDKTPHVVKS